MSNSKESEMKNMGIFMNIFKRAAALAILVSAAGCRGYLNVQPQGEVIPETDEEFAAIIHNRLRDIEGGGDEYVIGNMDAIKHLEGCADNLDANIRTSASLTFFAGEEIDSRQRAYEESWKIVRDCNIVIENMSGRDTDIARGALSAAYSMKGIIYYNLLREFCQPWSDAKAGELPGIPVVESFGINDKPLRGTIRQTYDYAKAQLDKALALNPTDPKYLFTEWIIKAYKAKLEFWCQNWDSVVSLCEDIIASSGVSLTPISEYAGMINAQYEAKGEVLVRSHINNSSELDWYFSYSKSYLASRPASARLIRLFGENPEKDVRYAASFNSKRMNVKTPECKVRLSEIVLMLAEAYYHKGDNDSALRWLNELRRNRIEDVSDLTMALLPTVRPDDRIVVDCQGKAVTPLLQAIIDERRKELYMEGDRWYELKRNGCPEWWVISNGLKYTTREYLYTSPISKSDVDLNPGLEQNPGYVY